MEITTELIAKAKKLAMDNYTEWGQWVVECMDDAALAEDLADFDTLDEWVEIRKRVADAHGEIENTAW